MTKAVFVTLLYLSKIEFQEFGNIIHFFVTTNSGSNAKLNLSIFS
jgi:hypothetical protein